MTLGLGFVNARLTTTGEALPHTSPLRGTLNLDIYCGGFTLAMVDGLPVAHTVFAGNRRDSTTVQAVIADLRQRLGLGRFVFVGDRGMKSEGSVAA